MRVKKRLRTQRRTARPHRHPVTRGDPNTVVSVLTGCSKDQQWFFLVLGLGILLRIVVSLHLGYLNNDNHLEVVEYVAQTWVPAHADQFNQGYHPPLYYFLAASFFWFGGVGAVHLLSLMLSIATLAAIALLIH